MRQDRMIPVPEALEMAARIGKEGNLSQPNIELLRTLVASCPIIGGQFLRMRDVTGAVKNFASAVRYKDSSYLRQRRGLCVDEVVGVKEFTESPEYMNQAAFIRPVVLDGLIRLFDSEKSENYVECVLTGATGWGKSFLSLLAVAYMVYKLSCYHNPQIEYDLAPGTSIVFILQSKKHDLSKRVLFEQLSKMMALSPYFKDRFPYDPRIKSEMRFPKNVYVIPVGGSDTAAIGMNVFGGCFPAGQEYAVTPCNFSDISYIEHRSKILTMDESNCIIPSKNYARSVCTGIKKLLRLTFEDGSKILCTKEQMFRKEGGGWLAAKDAVCKRLQIVDLRALREQDNLFDAAFADCPQDGRQGIQENVSHGKALRKWPVGMAAKEKGEARQGPVPVVRWRVPNDLRETSLFSRDNSCGIQEEISKGESCNVGSEGRLEREVQKACAETARRSQVSGRPSEGDKEDAAPCLEKDGGVATRSEMAPKDFPRGEGTVSKVTGRDEKKDVFGWSVRQGQGTVSKEEHCFLPEKERGLGKTSIEVGGRSGLFAGLHGQGMEIRGPYFSIPRAKGGMAPFPGGFCGRRPSFGGEGRRYRLHGQTMGVQEKGGFRTQDYSVQGLVCRRCDDGLQLDEQEQISKSVFCGASRQISALRCICVEELGFYAPVYDIEEVEGTHAFLSLLGNDHCLVAHNCIDEMNYMARVLNSERFEGVGTDDREYDQAERTYSTLIKRMKGRFMQKGRLPGKLLLVSSVNYPGDFTDRKIEEAKTDPTILPLRYTQWEALPKEYFSGEKFYVERGNDFRRSRVLRSREEAVEQDDVIEVPVEYKSDFERDVEGSLRDYAGFTSSTHNPFIPYRELLVKAQEEHKKAQGGRMLFRVPECVIDQLVDSNHPDWESLVDMKYIEECIINPMAPFALHIDLGVSEDAAGLAVGRIYGYKMLPSSRYYSPKAKSFIEVRDMRVPIYMIDGALRLVAPPDGRQIDFAMVRDLVLWLRGKLYIKWATLDTYQSVMMIQAFRKSQIRSGVLSVDKDIAPYVEVKLAVKDERILLPPHETLARELRELKKDQTKNRVDHIEGGSKDVSDALAGTVFVLQTKEADYGRARRRPGVLVPDIDSPSVVNDMEVVVEEASPRRRERRVVRIHGRLRG